MDDAESINFRGQTRTRSGDTGTDDLAGDYYRIGISNNSAVAAILSLPNAGPSDTAAVWLIEDKNNNNRLEVFDELLTSATVTGPFPKTGLLNWYHAGPPGLLFLRVFSTTSRDLNYRLDASGIDAAFPRPKLVDISINPTTVAIDQPITITIRARNDRGLGGPDSSITASVLYSDGSTDGLDIAGPSEVGWASHTRRVAPGGSIYSSTCQPMIALHHLIEAGDKNWTSGEEHSMRFTITPHLQRPVKVRVRVSLRAGVRECDSFLNVADYPSGQSVKDQQDWDAREFILTVPPPAPKLTTATISTSFLEIGERATVSISAQNDGANSAEGAIHASVQHSQANEFIDVSPPLDVGWAGSKTKYFAPSQGAGKIFNRGECVARSEAARNWFLEAWENGWPTAVSHPMRFEIVPKAHGIVKILLRTTMQTGGCNEWISDPPAGTADVEPDEQGWECRVLKLLVGRPLAKAGVSNPNPVPGERIRFSARASQAASPDRPLVNYLWNLGDGTQINGVEIDHAYSASGGHRTYVATLAVVDSQGQSATISLRVPVSGQQLGEPAGTSFSSDPVNLATGNYIYEHVDLRVPGKGIPFEFKRFYNSKSASAGGSSGLPLGVGWTHSYNISLSSTPSNVVVFFDDAHTEQFVFEAGSYEAEPGVFNRLVRTGDETFILSKKGGIEYTFNASGSLQTISDRNGNTLRLQYRGNVLSSITDTAGRTFVFLSDASGRLSGITDPLGRRITFDYDAANNLVAVVDANGGVSRYAYDASHQMTDAFDARGTRYVHNVYDELRRVVAAQSDAEGALTIFTYDFLTRTTHLTNALGAVSVHRHNEELLVTNIVDELGNAESFGYDAGRNRILMVNKNGARTHYAFDARGNPTNKVDALGQHTSARFDAMDNPLWRKDSAGHSSYFSYDGRGNLQSVSNALGRQLHITVNDAGLPAIVTDANGHSTTNRYDQHGNLSEVIDPLANSTRFFHDAVGRKLMQINTAGHTNSFAYDANDNLRYTIDALGHTNAFFYDANDYQIAHIGPRGAATTNFYDVKDRLIAVRDALGGVVSNAYDKVDRRDLSRDVRGNVTHYAYDLVGNLIAVTNALQQTTRFTYDPEGNQTSIIDHHGQIIASNAFDQLGRRVWTMDGASNATWFRYDPIGRLIATTNANQQVTEFRYDALGRLTNVIDANRGNVIYHYDKNGNRLATTNPNGHSTSNIFDAANRLVRTRDLLGNTEEFAYDSAGNVVRKVDSKGQATHYVYDANDQLTNVSRADGSVVTFVYDEVGNRTAMRDSVGLTQWQYDLLNRLTNSVGPFGHSVVSEHDAAGNRRALTYPGNRRVSYEYDGLNRMQKVTDWQGGATEYVYNDRGNLAIVLHPNRTGVLLSYDRANRLVGLTNELYGGTNIASYHLTLDGVGNLRELVSEQPLEPILQLSSTSYRYDEDNRLDRIDGAATQHDANGNVIFFRTNLFRYDTENRLVEHAISFFSSTQSISRCIYDGLGNRLQTVTSSGARNFVSDHAPALKQVLAEIDEKGELIAFYVYGLGLVSRIDAQGKAAYYHYDFRGNTVALTDAEGHVTDSYAYGTFGERANQAGALSNPFRFLGRYGVFDDGSGVLYVRARHYSPELGRFLSKDPLTGRDGESQSLNRYIYSLNNPFLYADITGLSPKEISSTYQSDFCDASLIAGGAIGITADDVMVLLGFSGIIKSAANSFLRVGARLISTSLIRQSVAAEARSAFSIPELVKAGSAPDRQGYTVAGRSLTKHARGARGGNQNFPPLKGNPEEINRQAENLVKEILEHPEKSVRQSYRPRFGQTLEVSVPDGRGIVYDSKGRFLFFSE